jgi:hypothetical protein
MSIQMEPKPDVWQPLGSILVDAGAITEQQLEVALEEQKHSGRRLGEVLVDLDFVSASVITSVLLEQCGIDLSRESGFGSGLRGELERRGSRSATAPEQWVPFAEDSRPDTTPPPAPSRRRRLFARDRNRDETARLTSLLDALQQRARAVDNELNELRRLLHELVYETAPAATASQLSNS